MNGSEGGKIITFYSYKGGTGRTMAVANVACLLAQWQDLASEKPILVIDWDLDSPGLHKYFQDLIPGQDTASSGLIELFEKINDKCLNPPEVLVYGQEETLLRDISLENYVTMVELPRTTRPLYLMKAGDLDPSSRYLAKVRAFDWETLLGRAPNIFQAFADLLSEKYSFVLIDSRTGFTDISDISTKRMPEILITVFTPNKQSLDGLEEVLLQASQARTQDTDLRRLIIYPLPSRVDTHEEAFRKIWRHGSNGIDGYQSRFQDLFRGIYSLTDQECDLKCYFDLVQIQHSSRFSYGEEIAVLIEDPEERLTLANSYFEFTRILVSGQSPWRVVRSSRGQVSQSKLESLTVEIDRLSGISSQYRQSYDWLRALLFGLKAVKLIHQSSQQDISILNSVKERACRRLRFLVDNIVERNRFEKHGDDIWDISVARNTVDGTLIISGGEDQTLKLWGLDGRFLFNVNAHQARVRDVAFCNDGVLIASVSDDFSLKLWQRNGTEIAPIRNIEAHQDHVIGVCFCADLSKENDKRIVTSSNDRMIKIWSVEGELLAIGEDHADRVWDVSFCRFNQWIGSVSSDGTLKLWSVEGELIHTLSDGNDAQLNGIGALYSLSFHPNGSHVAAAGSDGKIRIWNLTQHDLYNTPWVISKHKGEIYCVDYSPSGQYLSSAGKDETVRVWRQEEDGIRILYELFGHRGRVQSARFVTENKLISCGGDNTIRLWQLKSGQEIVSRTESKTLDSTSNGSDDRENTEELIKKACEWLHDYLENNSTIVPTDRSICTDI